MTSVSGRPRLYSGNVWNDVSERPMSARFLWGGCDCGGGDDGGSAGCTTGCGGDGGGTCIGAGGVALGTERGGTERGIDDHMRFFVLKRSPVVLACVCVFESCLLFNSRDSTTSRTRFRFELFTYFIST